MDKKKKIKRRDRYLASVSNLLFFTKDYDCRDDVLIKLDWAFENLGKEDRVLRLRGQKPDGHWPHGTHYHGDTTIYRTTMTILMPQVYYRFPPGW